MNLSAHTQEQRLESVTDVLAACGRSDDFMTRDITIGSLPLEFCYYKTLVDSHLLEIVIHALQEHTAIDTVVNLHDLITHIPLEELKVSDQSDEVLQALLQGSLLIRCLTQEQETILIPMTGKEGIRSNNDTENEFSVIGPKVGFVESMPVNLHLIRMQLRTTNLIVKEITVGSLSQSKVAILYVEGIVNPDNVTRMEERLKAIDFDVVFDTSQLDQLIADNSFTPFPLFTTTERRDRVIYALITGQVAVISDGSPSFITGPSTLFDFFVSPEDYYLPWALGSFFRLIRIFGVIFSLFASALYVALMTFHYEVVPKELLGKLISTRQSVPFPPLFEAIFLETTIEFLREAGARLPNRIGQTLGVVGGIILGQAAVEAALTSNVLIIIVSLSALASFVTPIYKMSNAIRFLRFPIILLASLWGALGIAIGLCFLLVHLSRLKSLGSPYMSPFFPMRFNDLKDSLIRASYEQTNTRPSYLRPLSFIRYKPGKMHRTNRLDEE
ncbi:tetrahydromethanopterin S-methyltransferase subunit G [Paenibacillus sp. W4I10]|uniref:spore germination protein n=1 Tax=Paenibacillus sp. W4I10 TaxID=3042298 RepID=UPI00277E508C|nr:spore germination protein [Paenibacillus sp. W4I10]MDQ0724845.1 tetrahydromethanopterin S-methyltransferase subunit G [Paenibacillus sp. W4I10]